MNEITTMKTLRKHQKKWFISNLFPANHSNYALTFQLHFQNLPLNIHVKCL